jgi:methylmalonyl-CoA/ethylmalonyl-CoA epimerase
MSTISPSWFGAGVVLDHAGLAVRSITDLFPGAEVVHDPTQKVRVAFIDVHGARVELIEPAGPDSPVTTLLKRGPGVYHLCYKVPSLEGAVAEAAKNGFSPVGQPAPAPAFGGKRIAWVYHPKFGLFELVEA